MAGEKELFDELLGMAVEASASDVHFTSGQPPVFRILGRLESLDFKPLAPDLLEAIIQAITTDDQKRKFRESLTLDMGYTDPGGERFRVNCYMELGMPAIAVRHLDQRLLSMEELGLPPELRDLAYLRSGLVLVTGITGSGKSTTLAALIDEINTNINCHIMTVEDPVEFVHRNKKGLVHHREVHTDVPDFASAVRGFMRQDPDVIMIGEMRDIETMQAAITAAETGHLVFSTLHTGEAVGAVERFIGHFPGNEQNTARHRISLTLKAVVAQCLLPSADTTSRVPVIELLRVNTAVASMIKNSKSKQIYAMMESGAGEGMWTHDQALAKLVTAGRISRDMALRASRQTSTLLALLGDPDPAWQG